MHKKDVVAIQTSMRMIAPGFSVRWVAVLQSDVSVVLKCILTTVFS